MSSAPPPGAAPPSSSAEEYEKALQVTQRISAPALGFVVAAHATNSDINRQNNTIIELLLTINTKLDLLLKKPIVSDVSTQVADITKQLKGLSLGVKPVSKKEPFFVYKDPLKIFKEEKEKLKKISEDGEQT